MCDPYFLDLAQQFCNHIKTQTKRTLYQQIQDFLHNQNSDSLQL